MPTATAEAGPVAGSLTVSADSVRLSGSVRVDVAVAGPMAAPPGWPAGVLSEASRGDWLVEPIGEADFYGKTWRRSFRFEPFSADPAPLELAPLPVQTAERFDPYELKWPAVPVRVAASVSKADIEELRPITGIEEVPPRPAGPPASPRWPYPVAIIVLLIALIAWRRSRRRPPPDVWQWAEREARRLKPTPDDASAVDAAVREFCRRRWGVPAGRRTADELLTLLDGADGCPAAALDGLGGLLRRCERARFAGRPADVAPPSLLDEFTDWVRQAREAGPAG